MKKYPKYSIEEKNRIVEEYLSGKIGRNALLRKYNISSKNVLKRWVDQVREKGTTYDNRGKSSTGRPKKTKKLNPEEMTRDELIEYVKVMEDIKKLVAYQKKRKKNTK